MAKKKQKSNHSQAKATKTQETNPVGSGSDTDNDERATTTEQDSAGEPDDVVGEGMLLDYITGARVKESPKELVRQRIARALFHEYGIPVDCMERDFPVRVKIGEKSRNIKADIAIFSVPRDNGQQRRVADLRRAIVCRPEPKKGSKGVTKLRDHEAARKDLEEVEAILEATPHCNWGLWTNGLDFFFVRKEETRFETRFVPVGDWDPWGESVGSREVASNARMRRADPAMLRVSFRRCHNFVHGNQGMDKATAFWQFLYLIFCKMHDEQFGNGKRRFWAGPSEQFNSAGQRAIRDRVLPLFTEVKRKYKNIFRGNEEITLNDKALAFVVSELARYDLSRTDVDAKGAAYQEIVGSNLKGDRGQFFTPRGAIKLMVRMLDPKPDERVLDPACGTGGFLVAVLGHVLEKLRKEAGIQPEESGSRDVELKDGFTAFARNNVLGADFDEALVRATQMNLLMASGEMGHVYHLDSLEFPAGQQHGSDAARESIPLGSIDVLFTNPPFGADIPITDPNVLKRYDLAKVWDKRDDGSFAETGRVQGSVPPEILFIEQCINWLRPGGRMAIVLPDGILGNPGDEYIRWWVLKHAYLLASVDLPVECFVVEANVGVLTSLLFLKKKTEAEKQAEANFGMKDYDVFMAVAERVGFDRRGNALYKRHPDGEEIVEMQEERERITINGRQVITTLRRPRKIVDDDLPAIASAYAEYRRQQKEPGA